MALLDWIVIGVFCLALIGIVVWVVSQKNDNSADYFLGGKDATWIAIGASIFASNIGSEHLIGLAGGWCFLRYGNGSLGDSRMDDPDSWLGLRTLLYPKHGIYHAGVIDAASIRRAAPSSLSSL